MSTTDNPDFDVENIEDIFSVGNIDANEITEQVLLNQICAKLKQMRKDLLKECDSNAHNNPQKE